MVKGLENIYGASEFDLIDEDQVNMEDKGSNRYRLNLKGFELIGFKTEKIIGALDFISKIIEYNSIIPTEKYILRIKTLNKKFIPNVLSANKEENEQLNEVNKDLKTFLIEHNKLVQKNEFYRNERIRLKADFDETYKTEYITFQEILKKSLESLEHFNYKVKLHTENIQILNEYIEKYNDFMEN